MTRCLYSLTSCRQPKLIVLRHTHPLTFHKLPPTACNQSIIKINNNFINCGGGNYLRAAHHSYIVTHNGIHDRPDNKHQTWRQHCNNILTRNLRVWLPLEQNILNTSLFCRQAWHTKRIILQDINGYKISWGQQS